MYHQIIEDIPIYHSKFAVIITDEEETLKKNWSDVKELDFDPLIASAVHFKVEDKEHACYGYYVILFVFNTNAKSPVGKNISIGSIAHEALHGTSFLFKRRGIHHDPDNDEPFAYMVEFFADKIQDFINSVQNNERQEQ